MAGIANNDNFVKERLIAREAGLSAHLDKIIEKWGLVADYCRPS